MNKPNKFFDYILISIFALLSIDSLFLHFYSGSLLTINNYLGFVLLLTLFSYRIITKRWLDKAVFFLLVLLTLDIINFSVIVINGKIERVDENFSYNGLGFNILAFLILIIYIFINFDFIKSMLSASIEEEERQKVNMINFYYEKFSVVDNEEFEKILNILSEYPEEAQIALTQIEKERNNK